MLSQAANRPRSVHSLAVLVSPATNIMATGAKEWPAANMSATSAHLEKKTCLKALSFFGPPFPYTFPAFCLIQFDTLTFFLLFNKVTFPTEGGA